MASKPSYLDRMLGRLDALTPDNLSSFVRRLARERELFEAIFNTIREGIVVVNREGQLDYANAAAKRLIGLKGETSGAAQNLWKLVPGLYENLGRTIEEWGEHSPSAVTRQIEIYYPETRSLRLYVVPFGDTKDAALMGHFAIILSDITAERLSTDERIESERVESITLLAAGVAHEIGNPLNSINIHLQLLKRRLAQLKADAKTKEALEASVGVCAAEVSRLDGIIRNFLEAVRPSPPDFVETDLVALLQEVLSLLGEELGDRGLSVVLDVNEPLPNVMADKGQVKQVFFNLIKNAMQAMEPGGQLNIHTRQDDTSVYLYFADTGKGISQEDLARVFEPYFTTKKTGTGLGMMIVQRILRAHGAHIGIDSHPDKGTLVTLQFPRKDRKVRLLEAPRED